MGQALTAKTELFAAEEEQVSFPIQMEEPKASRTVAEEAPFVIPGRPDPAMAFGMEQGQRRFHMRKKRILYRYLGQI